jgi:hypothetical protein
MSVVDTAKTAYDLAKKGMTVEFQEKIMQLREEALELQEENLRLRKENRELKERIELQETVRFERRVYWRGDDEIPFCQYCYEKCDHLLIHLVGGPPDPDIPRNTPVYYRCRHCKAVYKVRGEGDFVLEGRS